ncbi:hypothetical protein [Ferroplasma sp.]|uniref:hypothetical protein n=1 Tax=Ferroplasma sp. TaxID=2591003 RepID=UPI00260FBECC|nr:hypothetical protein [Ferroplasma sp.]
MVSVEVKESLIPSYSIAESLIKEFHLTRAGKDKIDAKITDKRVKKALYEILGIGSDKH